MATALSQWAMGGEPSRWRIRLSQIDRHDTDADFSIDRRHGRRFGLTAAAGDVRHINRTRHVGKRKNQFVKGANACFTNRDDYVTFAEGCFLAGPS